MLTKTLVGNDFRALLWGRPRDTLGEKALLVPYQNLAAAALRTFVDRTEAETLGLGGEDRLNALHLAVAFRAGCSHLVTRDADFGLASEVCPVAVLQVA